MNDSNYQEILAMIAILAERINKLDHKLNGGLSLKSLQSYIDELRKEASRANIK